MSNSAGNIYCKICGRHAYYGETFVNGKCPDCIYRDNFYHQLNLTFAYECPDCRGRFNTPALDMGTAGLYKCPFCGKEMVGLRHY